MALFSVKNSFYLGAYQAAISEAGRLKGLSEQDAAERDFFVYRSYIAAGSYQIVLGEIQNSTVELESVKLLATYLSSDEAGKKNAIATLEAQLQDPVIALNKEVLLIAGIIYAHEQNFNEALKLTHAGETLDLCALNIHMYLKLNRIDRAEQQLKAMQKIDEDHTLTQLANAGVNLALGGSKVQESYYIFQELSEKFTETVPLINGKAVCYMQMGRFEDAEHLLLEALGKDSKHADTLSNLVACSLQLGKSSSRYFTELKSAHPEHPAVKRRESAETSFAQALESVA